MPTETWSSRLTFLLATAGAAVGLGNLWRFPFIAGENGGGAFVVLYLLFVLLFGVPIMMAEMTLGRRGGAGPVLSLIHLARGEGISPRWQWIGRLSILIPVLGLSFYAVVGGWAIAYVIKAATGDFSGLSGEQSQSVFNELLASPGLLILCHGFFIGGACWFVGRGLHHGIEWVGKFMMPALFLLLLVLVAYAIFYADIGAGLTFLFHVDFSRLSPAVVLMALGQAFFSLAVGVGVLITYSAYLPRSVSIPRSALGVALLDTLVAVMAGIAIFPLVFSYGLNPGSGPGLIFVTLPVAFGQMPAGVLVAFLFFLLLYFAALSTAVGMLEPVVAWLQDFRSWGRPAMTALAGGFCWLLGIAVVLSFNVWLDVRPLSFLPLLEDRNIFGLFDFVTSNLLIPLNGMLIALCVGWALPLEASREESGWEEGVMFDAWIILLRYIAPVVVFLILYTSLDS